MSPKSNEQFAAMRRESQERIEAAALRLFAEKGFHNTSISAIAKAAGISKGLLYNYYDSKEDLLKSLIEHVIEDYSGGIDKFLQSDLPAHQKLVATTESVVHMVQNDAAYWKLLTSLVLQQDVIENLRYHLDQRKEEMIRLAAVIFEQMGFTDPTREAMLYGATLDGMMLQYLSLGSDYPLEEMKNYLIKKYQP